MLTLGIKINMLSMLPYLSWFWQGTLVTILVSFVTVVLGCIIGFIVTLARRSKSGILNWLAKAYAQFIRGTPLLLQVYIWCYGLPQIGIQIPDMFGVFRSGLYVTVVIAMALNSGAYISEIFRGGLDSVDKGQIEAARSLGLTASQAMRFVILPQAIKTILPSLGNEFIMMIKESATISIVGVGDVMYQQKIIQAATYKIFEPLIVIAFIYFVLTTILTTAQGAIERKMNSDAKDE